MALRWVVDCDAHGAHAGDVVTEQLTACGKTVEVDLCHNHRRWLEGIVGDLLEAGRAPGSTLAQRRKLGGSAAGRTNSAKRSRTEELKQVRAWAREQGYDVADNGKVPEAVMAAYEESRT